MKITKDQIIRICQLLETAKQKVKELSPVAICYPLYEERIPIAILDEVLAFFTET